MFLPNLLKDVEVKVNEIKISNAIIDDVIDFFVQNMMTDSMKIINERDDKLREYKQALMAEKKLNAEFVEKRSVFTKSIKSQKQDYDFKEQIIQFLAIPITVEAKKKEDVVDNDVILKRMRKKMR